MSRENATEYAACVGIDWADKKHVWAQRASDSQKVEQGEFEANPEGVEAFVIKLRERFGGRPIAIALEQSRGPVVSMLGKYEHVVLYPVHPNTLNSYRQAFYPSGAKSDPCDAALILELLDKHRDRLRALAPDTVATRTLQLLVEARRDAVDEKTRYLNHLTSALKMYFPQMLEWLDVDSKLMCAMLERWPALDQLQQEKPAVVEEFLREHRYPAIKLEPLRQGIAKAIVATTDQAVIEASIFKVHGAARQLEALRESIAKLERRIEEIAKSHEDYVVFQSFPSAGAAMVPRLIAAMGTQRDRFLTAGDLQCHSGIAPVKSTSGNSEWIHWRWACPKFLRQTFVEWAWLSTRKSDWARAYYDQKITAGKSHHAAVRALAFKWQRIIFRCWKDRCPYDEARYVAACAARAQAQKSSPVKTASTKGSKSKSVKTQWKNVGGFSKPDSISC